MGVETDFLMVFGVIGGAVLLAKGVGKGREALNSFSLSLNESYIDFEEQYGRYFNVFLPVFLGVLMLLSSLIYSLFTPIPLFLLSLSSFSFFNFFTQQKIYYIDTTNPQIERLVSRLLSFSSRSPSTPLSIWEPSPFTTNSFLFFSPFHFFFLFFPSFSETFPPLLNSFILCFVFLAVMLGLWKKQEQRIKMKELVMELTLLQYQCSLPSSPVSLVHWQQKKKRSQSEAQLREY